ncbi:zinc finger ZAT5-like [Olea europaea subsp. europaea]|uniref:Zinc finger ZAT5-like n=1 Tax=Olea europaea subsp. europaea TaxID=158383 RepID=A0A8S0SR21_OLEEU|nr:zinc finger ZAT5-like [Olea europaea subsp. europaea]
MANCLILLTEGKTEKSCEKPAVMSSNVYQCKTCNRCFPSFTALGGHRASHKKPKTKTLEEHVLQISDNDHGTIRFQGAVQIYAAKKITNLGFMNVQYVKLNSLLVKPWGLIREDIEQCLIMI